MTLTPPQTPALEVRSRTERVLETTVRILASSLVTGLAVFFFLI